MFREVIDRFKKYDKVEAIYAGRVAGEPRFVISLNIEVPDQELMINLVSEEFYIENKFDYLRPLFECIPKIKSISGARQIYQNPATKP